MKQLDLFDDEQETVAVEISTESNHIENATIRDQMVLDYSLNRLDEKGDTNGAAVG